ncbi:MAG: GNAT family N-acetyltransferase [Alteripontixanthobacter sp.]
MAEFQLETERLVLRDWRGEEDVDDFHRLGSDERVMATLGPLMTRQGSAALVADLQARSLDFGHTFWALERKSDSRVIGFCGLVRGHIAPIAGELEIGWRLAHDCWGKGYASEAAQAAIGWAFANRPGEAVIAITSQNNMRSRALMERLGMHHISSRDFEHPSLMPGDPLRAHVLYRKDPPQ